MRNGEGLQHHIIQEVSEPTSPESSPPSDKAPGRSAIANMLKDSPPSTPPRQEGDEDDEEAMHGSEDENDPAQRKIVITSRGVKAIEPTERTSLLGKDTRLESHHPDWIRGEQDIERQEVKRRPAWPKLRNTLLWPKEKGIDAARILFNPKAWDRKAIWQNGVAAPVGYLPAVILGTLLNILDALSYGKFRLFRRVSSDTGPKYHEFIESNAHDVGG